MSIVQRTPSKDLYIQRGAPDPLYFRFRAGGVNGTLVSFDNSLKFTFVNCGNTTTLGVGSGITLSTDETVANARATVQLTVAQSRTIPEGPMTYYEVQRTISGREEVIFSGNLIGEGGNNPDG